MFKASAFKSALRGSLFGVAAGGEEPGGSAPVNTVAPVVSGTAIVGQVLTSTTGTWTGDATITYSYQWKRGATNVGTNSANYTLVSADAGQSITCVVTGTNGVGSSTGTSNTRTPIEVTGGSISVAGGYRIHTFTSSADFTVAGGTLTNVEFEGWAGGGGGGCTETGSSTPSGGGGAGGRDHNIGSPFSLTAGVYPVVIGAGGPGSTANSVAGSNGSNTTFNGRTAVGGGGGGASVGVPGNGGSGGGGSKFAGTQIGGTGTAGQGFAGGDVNTTSSGAGGGGTSEKGEDGFNTVAGNGGDGLASVIVGTVYGGGGGAGDSSAHVTKGLGGSGGGGDGGLRGGALAEHGTANTGGGGGGGAANSGTPSPGGNGGSGNSFIRYPI